MNRQARPNGGRWPGVCLMLGLRLRRWPNIKQTPGLELAGCPDFIHNTTTRGLEARDKNTQSPRAGCLMVWKAERQYMLICNVSRYYLLALHGSVVVTSGADIYHAGASPALIFRVQINTCFFPDQLCIVRSLRDREVAYSASEFSIMSPEDSVTSLSSIVYPIPVLPVCKWPDDPLMYYFFNLLIN